MSGKPLRILFVTPECAPWVKTGGLGDVSAALPATLTALGHDVQVMIAVPAQAGWPAATLVNVRGRCTCIPTG